MKTIFEEYLDGVNSKEYETIKNKLKNHKYSRLEINLTAPYKYEVVLP